MLMMATTIHINQNRKLPITVGTSLSQINGTVMFSAVKNRNHPVQHQKDFFIGYHNKVSLSV